MMLRMKEKFKVICKVVEWERIQGNREFLGKNNKELFLKFEDWIRGQTTLADYSGRGTVLWEEK